MYSVHIIFRYWTQKLGLLTGSRAGVFLLLRKLKSFTCMLSHSVVSDSLWPHGLQPASLLCPWDFPGKNTGVGCHALLQGIFLTQGSNLQVLGLLHWQADSLPLSHQGSPIIYLCISKYQASQVVLLVKNPITNEGDLRVVGLIPGLGRSSGGGHGNQLQYFCLKNPMDRGAWWATIHRVANNRTRLKWLSPQAQQISMKKIPLGEFHLQ